MANLIDSSYFINDINLPAQYLTGTGELISDYIEKYEKEVLIFLLGYDEYKNITATPASYSGLINGAEYTVGGYTREWSGLVNTEKDSLIAYYVYYKFSLDQISRMEGIGAVIAQGENSVRTAMDGLMIKAWNRFVERYNNAVDYILQNSATYPKWIYTEVCKSNQFGI